MRRPERRVEMRIMPELPEIETIKNVIEPQIQGLTIENITVSRPEAVAYPGANEFCKAITGQVISSMARRGKFLMINLKNSGISKLGFEPLSSECNAEYLKKRFGKRKKAIKGCLLDQSVIAGIGNIYSDEILFRAKIHPSAPANSLTDKEWERLTMENSECLRYYARQRIKWL